MTDQLFYRDGRPFTGTALTDGGKNFTREQRKCGRCGGPGRIDSFRHVEGGVCFQCNGSGLGAVETVKLFTADKLAKLNGTQAKKLANKQAKHAAAAAVRAAEVASRVDAFRAKHADILQWLSAAGSSEDEGNPYREGFLGDMLRRADKYAEWSEAQEAAIYAARDKRLAEKAKAAASQHVGTVGQRVTLMVTVERESVFYRQAFMQRGWGNHDGSEAVYITTMRDDAGNALIVKSPRFRAEVGSRIEIRGTVKDHSNYRGEAQTLLNRVEAKEAVA